MLTGYNTDIKHNGVVYHVQTEDSGVGNPVIVSLVYQGGRILASRKTSYAQLLSGEDLVPKVRSLLENQHRAMIKAVLTGSLDTGVEKETPPEKGPVPGGRSAPVPQPPPGPSPLTVRQQPPGESAPSAASASASATEKNLDQVILEYLASELEND